MPKTKSHPLPPEIEEAIQVGYLNLEEYVRKLEGEGESIHWSDTANAVRKVRAALDELRRAEGFIR